MRMSGENSGWSTERTENTEKMGEGEVEGADMGTVEKIGETTCVISCDFLTL